MNLNFLHMRSLKTRVTLFTLAIFLIGIWTLAFYTIRMLREDMQRSLGEQQFSTVSLLAAQVNRELDERLRSLEIITEKINQTILDNPPALQELLENRPLLQNHFNGGVLACLLDGTTIAETPPSTGRIGVNYMDRDHVAVALKEGKASIGRPVLGRKLQTPIIGMTAPIRDVQGKVIGALTGMIDLGKPNFLDKIAENRYGKTGGYVLLIPQHRLIIMASDKSRNMQSLPALGTNPMLDRFLQGYEGSAVYTNPLSEEVIGSAKQLPVSDWLMGVTLPTEEAFAPIREMQQRMLQTTIFLTILMWVLSWWMLKRQLSPMIAAARTLATLSDTDQPLQLLPITSQDEIGDLIGGFNRLLETIAQREEALKESEERQRKILQTAMDGYWMLDMKGRILEVNEAYCRISGYSAQELLVMGISDLDAAETVNETTTHLQKVIAQGENRFESLHRRRDGIIINVEASVHYMPKAERIVAFIRDITERKRIDQSLRESEMLYRSIGESIDYGVWICTPDGRNTYASQSFLKMVGITQEECSNFGWGNVLHPDDADRTIEAWQECVRTGGTWDIEHRFRGIDGKWHPVLARGVPVRGDQGKVIGWAGIDLDISRLKRTEEQLKASLSEKEVLLKEVHHRVKNNLQVITSLINLQANSLSDEKLQGVIGDVRDRVRTMALVHEKLYQTENLARLDFAEYASSLLKYLWDIHSAANRNISLNMSFTPLIFSIEMAVHCGLILNELVTNAIKHAFPDARVGEVTVTLEHDTGTGTVCLRVKDNGVGLPENLDWRQTSSLGLQLVQMLAGQIRTSVQIGPGPGTEFQINFKL